MGMYDVLRLSEDVELPGFPGDPSEVEWQTKELQMHPALEVYKIEDGRLFKENAEYEHVPEEERPAYNEEIGGFEHEFERMFGMLSKNRHGWDDTEYHGVFEFHASHEDTYYSYESKFTDGELVDITKQRPTED